MEEREGAESVSSPDVRDGTLLVSQPRSSHNSPIVFTVPNVTGTEVPASTRSGSLPFQLEDTCFTANQFPVRLRSPVVILQCLSVTALDPDLTSLDCLVGCGTVESVSSGSLLRDTLTSSTTATYPQSTLLAGVYLVVEVPDQLSVLDEGPGVSTEGEGLARLDVAGLSLLGVWSRATCSSVLFSVVDATSAIYLS